MKARVYLRAEGDLSSLTSLNESLSQESKVELSRRKKIVNGKVEHGDHYWQSKEENIELLAQNSMELEKKIFTVTEKYTSELSCDLKGIQLSVVAAVQYENEDEVGGLWLSNNSIELLHKLGATLDFDAYFKS